MSELFFLGDPENGGCFFGFHLKPQKRNANTKHPNAVLPKLGIPFEEQVVQERKTLIFYSLELVCFPLLGGEGTVHDGPDSYMSIFFC